MNAVVAFKPRFNPNVQDKVNTYKEIKAEIKALEEKRDLLKEELKTYLQPDNCIYNERGHKIASLSTHDREYCKVKQFKSAYPTGFEEYFYTVEIETLRTK